MCVDITYTVDSLYFPATLWDLLIRGVASFQGSRLEGIHCNLSQAYYRRASANMALGKFRLALKDFEAVKKVRPRDKDALVKYTECNKVVRQIAFEKAIAVESSRKKPSETIDLDSMGESYVCI